MIPRPADGQACRDSAIGRINLMFGGEGRKRRVRYGLVIASGRASGLRRRGRVYLPATAAVQGKTSVSGTVFSSTIDVLTRNRRASGDMTNTFPGRCGTIPNNAVAFPIWKSAGQQVSADAISLLSGAR